MAEGWGGGCEGRLAPGLGSGIGICSLLGVHRDGDGDGGGDGWRWGWGWMEVGMVMEWNNASASHSVQLMAWLCVAESCLRAWCGVLLATRTQPW